MGAEATDSEITSVGWTLDTSGNIIYRIWDMNKVNEQGIDLKKTSDSEKFVIKYDKSKVEVDVASVKGFKDSDGKVYHSLTNLNNYYEE